MKNECSIVRDVLPLYFENMVSEETAAFIKEHLVNCPACAAELELLKAGRQVGETEIARRKSDANVITALKKKIGKKVLKVAAVICLVFAVLLGAVLLYTGIGHSVTQEDISLTTKVDGGYSYIVLETEAGKSLSFDSKAEDILNDKKEVCGRRIILYNLQYHNNFSQNTGLLSWGSPINVENQYVELVVELEDGTVSISNAE